MQSVDVQPEQMDRAEVLAASNKQIGDIIQANHYTKSELCLLASLLLMDANVTTAEFLSLLQKTKEAVKAVEIAQRREEATVREVAANA